METKELVAVVEEMARMIGDERGEKVERREQV
jgi:hypothetical protein